MSNISRSEENQTLKFGQFIEYNMRNTFVEKSYPNVAEKLLSETFLKNEN